MLSPKQLGRTATVADMPAGGAIVISGRIEQYRALVVSQTTAGQTVTLPSPVDTSVILTVDVINAGTTAFSLNGFSVSPLSTVSVSWTGVAWVSPPEQATGSSLFKGTVASTAALAALPKANLVDGETYTVGLDLFTWRPAASSGSFQPSDTAFPGVEPGYWVKIAGRYAGLYSNTSAYNQYDIVLHDGDLWVSNSNRGAGVWTASPVEGLGSNSFTRLKGVIRGQFSISNSYASGDLVYDSATTLGLIPGIYRVLSPYTSGDAPSQDNFELFAGRPVFYGERAARAYVVGDYGEEAGKLYRCVVPNGVSGLLAPFNPTDWEAVGEIADYSIEPHTKVDFSVLTLADAATITWDLSEGLFAQVTLSDNRTLAAPSGLDAGQSMILVIDQDGTGGRTITWDSQYKFPGGVPAVLTSAANSRDVFYLSSVDGSTVIVSAMLDVK